MKRIPILLALGCLPLFSGTGSTPTRMIEPQTSFMGPVAEQTFPESTFFYLSCKTNRNELPSQMQQLVPRLYTALSLRGLGAAGPLVLVYHGPDQDPAKPFDMEVGVLVPPGTKPAGDGLVRTLPLFKCATTVFTGPYAQVGKAYEALFPALLGSGKTPTAEFRQMLLYFENEQSSNNMMLVQVGIQ